MSSNRLFIYDEQSHLAVCIAKGYSTGWSTGGGREHVNKFFGANHPIFGNPSYWDSVTPKEAFEAGKEAAKQK